MDSRRLNFSALQRVAALVCAATYLTGGIEGLPQALALGAWLEGSHTVRIACSGERVTVVLSHERGLPSRPDFVPRHQPGNVAHRHGAAARMLCVFVAQRSPQADHVANFAAGSVCENLARVIEAQAGSVEMTAAALTATLSCETGCPPAPAFPNTDFSQPRPPDSLRLLRSTVLVI
jgi:hypothetical protein